MTATGHAVIGVVIAATISNPVVAIPLAVASHIAGDLFPHWDPGTNRDKKSHERFIAEGVLDALISFVVTFLMVVFIFPGTELFYAYIIVFAAQFFDWITAPYLFFKIKNPAIFKWSYIIQKKYFDNKLDKPWGIIGQVGILVILVIFAKLI